MSFCVKKSLACLPRRGLRGLPADVCYPCNDGLRQHLGGGFYPLLVSAVVGLDDVFARHINMLWIGVCGSPPEAGSRVPSALQPGHPGAERLVVLAGHAQLRHRYVIAVADPLLGGGQLEPRGIQGILPGGEL